MAESPKVKGASPSKSSSSPLRASPRISREKSAKSGSESPRPTQKRAGEESFCPSKKQKTAKATEKKIKEILSKSSPTTHHPFHSFLAKQSISVLPTTKHGEVLTIDQDAPIQQVFEILQDSHIHSLPVIDKDGACHSLVDVADVVDFVTALFSGKHTSELQDEDGFEYFLSEVALSEVAANQISDLSSRNHFLALRTDDSTNLFQVGRLLALSKVQRLPVLDCADRPVNLVTQTSFLEFVYEHVSELGKKKDMPVSEILKREKHLAVVKKDDTALTAFRQMHNKRVTCAAVVDGSGVLVEILSASDLRMFSEWIINGIMLRMKNLTQLMQPLHEFLSDLRATQKVVQPSAYWLLPCVADQLLSQPGTAPQKLLTCTRDDSLQSVLQQLVMNSVHQLFVVDPATGSPIALLSLTQVIKALLRP